MEKIDHRISYFMVLDTETANTLDDALVYDLGYAIIDKRGKVYETASFVNTDIFLDMKDIMESAYYAEKIPNYYKDIWDGTRTPSTTLGIRRAIYNACEKWNVKAISAHNARFDHRAVNTTIRYITKSKLRYFLPYGIPIFDTLKMATDIVAKMPTYVEFCEKHGFMTKHRTPRPQLTAEVLYRFISGDIEFIESHTGLEDVMIEKEIFAYCYRQKKSMKKLLYEN